MAPYHTDEEDDFDFHEGEPEEEEEDDEEYVNDPRDDEEPGEPVELEFKDGRSEMPRPLQMNREYDEWSAAIAPPIFETEKD